MIAEPTEGAHDLGTLRARAVSVHDLSQRLAAPDRRLDGGEDSFGEDATLVASEGDAVERADASVLAKVDLEATGAL